MTDDQGALLAERMAEHVDKEHGSIVISGKSINLDQAKELHRQLSDRLRRNTSAPSSGSLADAIAKAKANA